MADPVQNRLEQLKAINQAGAGLAAAPLPNPTPEQLLALSRADAEAWQSTYLSDYTKSLAAPTSAEIRLNDNAARKIQKSIRGDTDPNATDFFKIEYVTVSGVARNYVFSLLPAIDVSGGRGMGTMSGVPEVKPGIVIRTAMRQKNIPVPGGVPVIQTIGVDSTILQAVGAFIGTERKNGGSNDRGDISVLYEGSTAIGAAQSSETTARAFMTDVVQSGRPVVFHTKSTCNISPKEGAAPVGMELRYKGVIVNFKFYAARRNRTYYTLDMLISEYDINKRA
jgi:hypothetical protein